MTLRAHDLRTHRRRSALQGRPAPTNVVSASTPLRAVKFGAMLLGGEWLCNNVADIICTDASPQKRRSRPPGADKGGVGAVCVASLQLPVVMSDVGTRAPGRRGKNITPLRSDVSSSCQRRGHTTLARAGEMHPYHPAGGTTSHVASHQSSRFIHRDGSQPPFDLEKAGAAPAATYGVPRCNN